MIKVLPSSGFQGCGRVLSSSSNGGDGVPVRLMHWRWPVCHGNFWGSAGAGSPFLAFTIGVAARIQKHLLREQTPAAASLRGASSRGRAQMAMGVVPPNVVAIAPAQEVLRQPITHFGGARQTALVPRKQYSQLVSLTVAEQPCCVHPEH